MLGAVLCAWVQRRPDLQQKRHNQSRVLAWTTHDFNCTFNRQARVLPPKASRHCRAGGPPGTGVQRTRSPKGSSQNWCRRAKPRDSAPSSRQQSPATRCASGQAAAGGGVDGPPTLLDWHFRHDRYGHQMTSSGMAVASSDRRNDTAPEDDFRGCAPAQRINSFHMTWVATDGRCRTNFNPHAATRITRLSTCKVFDHPSTEGNLDRRPVTKRVWTVTLGNTIPMQSMTRPQPGSRIASAFNSQTRRLARFGVPCLEGRALVGRSLGAKAR